MPNNPIDPKLHTALMNAFGGSPAAPVQQPSAPIPASPEAPGMGSSLYNALFGGSQEPQVNPYENVANKATGKPYR